MDVTIASSPTPGRDNEDWVMASDQFVIVLDGVTSPPELETGCVHGPAWLVRILGAALATRLATERRSLRDLLRLAIADLRAAHSDTCDLNHPASPSSTVAVLRELRGCVDYLVLCDSSTVFADRAGRVIRAVTDDRTLAMRGLTRQEVAAHRNAPGGFWVASTDPAAAEQASVGTLAGADLGAALVCTDGVGRLVERFDWTWSEVLGQAERESVRSVIDAVRAAERAAGPPDKGKQYDDATLALCRFGPSTSS